MNVGSADGVNVGTWVVGDGDGTCVGGSVEGVIVGEGVGTAVGTCVATKLSTLDSIKYVNKITRRKIDMLGN